jgi:hypothetical protein
MIAMYIRTAHFQCINSQGCYAICVFSPCHHCGYPEFATYCRNCEFANLCRNRMALN